MVGALFTCAGQRVDIVSAFSAAGARTVAVDSSALAPALYAAQNRVLVPPVDDSQYVASIQSVIERYDVDLIVPLSDLDQLLLAQNRGHLNALLLLASAETISLCEDKYAAHCFFAERGIPSPRTWLPDEVPDDIEFPAFVKARAGFGSRHIYRAANRAELRFFLGYTTVPSIVQQACLGTEFSIDVFCDRDGRCVNAIPRSMLESRGGESVKGTAIRDRELIDHGQRVAEALGIIGPANVQCFREPNGSLPVTDVNPRFGGGFPVPTAAGSRYPQLAIALAEGKLLEPELGEFEDGITMARYFSQIIARPGDDGLLKVDERDVAREAWECPRDQRRIWPARQPRLS